MYVCYYCEILSCMHVTDILDRDEKKTEKRTDL